MNLEALELPIELQEQVRSSMQTSQLSLEEWMIGAIAQKLEKEKTRQVFARYAEKADFDRFDQILARVPDVDPVPGDELL
jgi:hypothetical protein